MLISDPCKTVRGAQRQHSRRLISLCVLGGGAPVYRALVASLLWLGERYVPLPDFSVHRLGWCSEDYSGAGIEGMERVTGSD